MTNADKIRAMSDEELCNLIVYQVCPEEHDRDYCHSTRCKQCWLEWLKQEVSNHNVVTEENEKA